MRYTCSLAPRLALAAYMACVGCATLTRAPSTIAAASSTWYWQNPLPLAYTIKAVACRSATSCVAVGQGGSLVTTSDGGRIWTKRVSGTPIDLASVICPGRAVCYAIGNTGNQFSPSIVHHVILKSVDGGITWRRPAKHLPSGPHEFLSSLACSSVTTCVGTGSDWARRERARVLRTTDGGKSWHVVSMPGRYQTVSVTCAPSTTICYAADFTANGAGPGGTGLLRSADGGKTWSARGLHPPAGISALACPGAGTCFAAATNCAECNVGDVFLTRDGGRTWRRVASQLAGSFPAGIVCPNARICYVSDGESVARTTNGGATWSVHHLPDPGSVLACPSPTTCYAVARFSVLKTSDGFGHTQETLARSVVHDFSLNDVSCASATACYAAGTHTVCPAVGPCYDVAAPFVATSDGGRSWRVTPTTRDLLARLSCPAPTVCYAIGESNGESRQVAFDHSGDGARTWQRTTWQQISHQLAPNNQALDISCVTVTTCYLLATVVEVQGKGFSQPLAAVLVTRDRGKTWSVKTGIDAAGRAGAPAPTAGVTLGRISCPGATTCFVLATVYPHKDVAILSTRNGGTSWSRHIPAPGAVPNSSIPWLGRELACPTVSTCYLLSYKPNPEHGNPNGLPGPVLVTHDAGATWHSTVVGNGPYLLAIACAAAQACRVIGPDGIFGTTDGGKTWQRQLVTDGTQSGIMTSIACPAVDTCYAVGDVAILGTHLRR